MTSNSGIRNNDENGVALFYNPESCTGCHLCELVCSFTHFRKSLTSLSRVIIYKDKTTATFIPTVCVSCPGMPCAQVCPENAIVRDSKTGMPKVLEDKCLGKECGKCVPACPYYAIRFEPKAYPYPITCDLCDGDPQCVKVCWSNALELVELTKESDPKRFVAAAKVHGKIKDFTKSL